MFKLVLSALLLAGVAQASMDKVEIMTEEYPPYNFTKDGKTVGIATDLLNETIKAMGGKMHAKGVQMQSWSRGYGLAQKAGEMNLLYSTTRTAEREKLFKWAGPISETRVMVFVHKSKADKVKIASMADLKNYKFSVILKDIGEELLLKNGVPQANLTSVDKFELIAKQAQAGRTDGFAYEENGANWLMKLGGFPAGEFVPAFELNKGELFYAFNKSVDDATIASFQKGLDTAKAKLAEIKAQYK